MLEWAKEHKVLAIATIGGILLLLSVIRRAGGGGGGATVVNTGPSEQAQLAAGNASLSAALQSQEAQLSFRAATEKMQTDYAIAALNAGVTNRTIDAQLTAKNLETSAALESQTRSYASELEALRLDRTTQVDLATLTAGTSRFVTESNNAVLTHQLDKNADQFMYQLDNERAIQDSNNRAAAALATTNANLQTGLAVVNAGVAVALNTNAANIQRDTIAAGVNRDILAAGVATTSINKNAETQQIAINAQKDLSNEYLHVGATMNKDALDAQLAAKQYSNQFNQNFINLVSSGKLTGGDAIALFATVYGQPSVGVAAQNAVAVDNAKNGTGGILSGIADILRGGGQLLFGAGV